MKTQSVTGWDFWTPYSFKLLSKRMVEENSSAQYSAKRADVRRSFRTGKTLLYTIGFNQPEDCKAKVLREKSKIILGCQVFKGEDYKKLCKWALAK